MAKYLKTNLETRSHCLLAASVLKGAKSKTKQSERSKKWKKVFIQRCEDAVAWLKDFRYKNRWGNSKSLWLLKACLIYVWSRSQKQISVSTYDEIRQLVWFKICMGLRTAYQSGLFQRSILF